MTTATIPRPHRPVGLAGPSVPVGTPSGDRGRVWYSWHLHAASFDPQALEDLVTAVVAPTIAAVARRDAESGHGNGPRADTPEGGIPAAPRPWFFMRYWQNGPHVRFRVADLDADGARWVTEELRRHHAGEAVQGPALARPAIGDGDYRRMASHLAEAGEGSGSLPLGSLLDAGVHAARYEPEVQRYGGTGQLMTVSEDLFRLSSVLSLRACLTRGGHRRNLGDGLEAMAATAAAWPGEPVGLLTRVRDSWTDWLRTAMPQVVEGIEPFARQRAAALAGQAQAVRDLVSGGPSRWSGWTVPLAAAARGWVDDLGAARALGVFASQLHMTQNRLGVGAGREAHLAATVLRLLEIQAQGGDRDVDDRG